MWLTSIELRDLRNLRHVELDLISGLNIFVGQNAQGKTSVLEGAGLIARGRSFRTDDIKHVIRRGTQSTTASGRVTDEAGQTRLAVRIGPEGRRLEVEGQALPASRYHGRFEVAVYSTDRLRVVRGTMRDRRQFIDRSAAALWPSYRRLLREYDRVVRQRNAALETGGSDLGAWTERLVEKGATLRQRRADYIRQLARHLQQGYRPDGELYEITVEPDFGADADSEHRRHLIREIEDLARRERAARRTLAGPARDRIRLTVGGDETHSASAGQVRSLLLALTLSALEVYRDETGQRAVALLDDLDSELDAARAGALCERVATSGQALVTTAHLGWYETIGVPTRAFHVVDGAVSAA
jgi:DNA replication and repair protein RecF